MYCIYSNYHVHNYNFVLKWLFDIYNDNATASCFQILLIFNIVFLGFF